MGLRTDTLKLTVPSVRVGAWQINFSLQDPVTRVMPAWPVEDDPATLARLAAIMSDRIVPCQVCGRDPYVCKALGCDPTAVSLLAASR